MTKQKYENNTQNLSFHSSDCSVYFNLLPVVFYLHSGRFLSFSNAVSLRSGEFRSNLYHLRNIFFHLSTFQKMKNLFLLALLCLALFMFQACDYAHSNVQTLITDDCGVTWKVIKAGETLPSRLVGCSYKVTIPDYPMQGDLKFKTAFKDHVLANIEVSYDYSIVSGIAYINEAKYLGKPNSKTDDASNSAAQYEAAENAVIDTRIKDVTRDLLISEDIVDFSQSDFEDHLIKAVNKELATKGVQINFLSFVPTPDDQTRQAIDVATALKIYKSKGIEDVGKSVTTARAGATKIEIVSAPTAK